MASTFSPVDLHLLAGLSTNILSPWLTAVCFRLASKSLGDKTSALREVSYFRKTLKQVPRRHE